MLVLLVAAFAAAADDPVAAIIDQARGARVEIFADVVFHLLDTNRVAEKDRVPLLEEIFLRADEARQAMPMRRAVQVAVTPHTQEQAVRNGQTVTIFRGGGAVPGARIAPIPAQLHLDALSIKCRVVKALLSIDSKRARDRFADIPRPEIPKADCTAALLLDPTDYFDTLGAVVTQGKFTASEQEKNIPFWMMESAVAGAKTSLEIVASARNLSHLAHNTKEALAMSSAFASALGMDDSNRNFTAAMANSNLVDAIIFANDRFVALGASPQTMLTALRGYLVRHLSAPRCADNGDSAYDDSLLIFGVANGHQTAIPPITNDETTPAIVEGVADITKPPDSPEFLDILTKASAVAEGDNSISIDELLGAIQAWKGAEGQDPTDVFKKKVAVYSVLLGPRVYSSPGNTTQQRANFLGPLPVLEVRWKRVMAAFVGTLSDPAFLDASPSDWLTEVRALEKRQFDWVDAIVGDNNVRQLLTQKVPTEFSMALIGSSLSALSVYGHLEILDNQPQRSASNRLF